MDKLLTYFDSLGIDFGNFWQAALLLLIGSFAISLLGRAVFGKRSNLSGAVSSVFAILFLYAGVLVLRLYGGEFSKWITPLPFISISGNTLKLLSFTGTHFTVICTELVNMIILAFLVNLADSWLPKCKNIIAWLFFRVLTVLIAFILHFIVTGLLAKFVPEGIATYAPVVLIAVLLLMLLTGALKILVGAAISTINPIIGALYTFFFANVIGKMITKAALTTAILGVIIFILEKIGIASLAISAAALPVYIPGLLILIVLWYVVGQFL